MKRESRGIQSIEVGGELLRALARCGEPTMLRDLAREAGMTPAKAHPYLASFSRIGLIEQDETTGRYEIGAMGLSMSRVRFIGRYFIGDRNVTGASFGIGVSF